jgi:hypothetical protein
MSDAACSSAKGAARVSVKANTRAAGVKAPGAGRSQNPRIIDAKLQGYQA